METIQAFRFQNTEGVFHRSVVAGTARAIHQGRNVIFLSRAGVRVGGVLRPLVTVEGELPSDLFLFQRLANCICNKRKSHIGADLPRQDDLAAQVQDRTRVQHAAGSRDVGDIRAPELIRICLVETAVQQIGVLMNSLLVAGIEPAASNDRQQAQLPHNAQSYIIIHRSPSLALDAIRLFARLLALHDQPNQPLIPCFHSLTFPPRIVSVAGNLKHFTHRFHAVLATESFDYTPLQAHNPPASNRKFRSISTVIHN